MKRTIYNAQTNETTEIPYTKDEIVEFEKLQKIAIAENAILEAEADAKATAKAAAEGKLAALGLTTEDLKALGLGGN